MSRASLDRWIRALRARRDRRAGAGRTPSRGPHRRRGAGAGRSAQVRTPGPHGRAYRPDHRARTRVGALAAHPATPFRPPGAQHPPGRDPAAGVRPLRGHRTQPAVGHRRAARPDRGGPPGGAVRAARRLRPLRGRAPLGPRREHPGHAGRAARRGQDPRLPAASVLPTTAARTASHQLAWSAAVLDIKLVHSRPGRPQGRGKIERWNRTVRDQFLVEIDTGADVPAAGASRWTS